MTRDKVLAKFGDLEPKEEGVKGLTFVNDCHTTE